MYVGIKLTFFKNHKTEFPALSFYLEEKGFFMCTNKVKPLQPSYRTNFIVAHLQNTN
ncbi:hypothetical protein HMPREF9372_2886 [Sporosarcina newyorkensis 2681]|uniref:Uncharacterized protein n=1 Tax=Sporosarcina newyorkensis 2681 TaxID=1027292 RepID=F9DVQ5_9BACL|nr:hypothetical protein HMPREF9372_2886 [Sporosarcina newyorkensis 2681]